MAARLTSRLAPCATAEDTFAVFDEVLQAMTAAAGAVDEHVVAAIQAIDETRGEIKIHVVAERLGLSERQLQRRFRETVGLTPKQFARIRRFRTSTTHALQEHPKSWSRVAAEHGFADQSHLIREYAQFVGEPPTTFAERVRAIDHGPVKP